MPEIVPGVDSWFEALARLTNVGVLMFDAEAQPQFASGLARQLLRCGEEEDLQDCVKPLIEAVTQAGACCDAAADTTEKEAFRDRFTFDGPDGRHTITAAGHAIRTDDCVGVLVLLWDEDQRQLMERDLRQASRFRQVGQLYQAMAHDLRSPVATILMASSVLRGLADRPAAQKETASDVEKWLDSIDEAVGTLDQSLQLLLGELSAPDTQVQDLDLRKVLESVYLLVLPQARQWNVGVTVQHPQRSAMLPSGNPSRLKLALLNLATNALHAMPEGGQLRIGLADDGTHKVVRVVDTGSGIPAEIREKIFEKYFTTKQTGSGIGLYLAKEVVEHHGGRIEFDTGAGGTEFRLIFPVSNA